MATAVIDVLRRFLPSFLAGAPALCPAQWRAVWAFTHCRTPVMGGHLYGCDKCGRREFAYHSCNHRSCPQCGRSATAEWVQRELGKRVGAPYFMVTFTGTNAIKYLGAYVCRTAIGDSRIISVRGDDVTFQWKDRADNNAIRTETIPGTEFLRRYLLHVLPRGMRSIRYFGFCHPAAKKKREQVAFHTGRPLLVGPLDPAAFAEPQPARCCPHCDTPLRRLGSVSRGRPNTRGPPPFTLS